MKKSTQAIVGAILVAGLAVTSFSLLPGFTSAKIPSGTLDNGLWANLDTRTCANLTAKISATIGNYESNRAGYFAAYTAKRIEIEKWLRKLAASGYDVKQLRRDLVQWNIRIVAMARSYDQYVKDLRRTQTAACGSSHGQFVRLLGQARRQFQDFQGKVQEVKRYWNRVIIPDIAALNSQVRDKYPIKEMK